MMGTQLYSRLTKEVTQMKKLKKWVDMLMDGGKHSWIQECSTGNPVGTTSCLYGA